MGAIVPSAVLCKATQPIVSKYSLIREQALLNPGVHGGVGVRFDEVPATPNH